MSVKLKNRITKNTPQSVQNNSFEYEIRSPETKKEWDNYYFLRWKILRSDFSDDIDSAKDELENQSYHVTVIHSNKQVIGVGRLHDVDDETSQIRYMAVDQNFRDHDFGTKILLKLMQNAKDNGNKYIILHERKNAVRFYKNNGFELLEKSHLLFGKIQHYLMKISL